MITRILFTYCLVLIFGIINAQSYTELQKIIASDDAAFDQFGFTSDIDGDYAVVGAPFNDDNGSESGSVYIYYRNQGGTDNWGEVTKITPSDGATADRFGFNVSIDGDNIAVGAMWDSDNGAYSGSVYIFNRNQGGLNNWGQVTKIYPSDARAYIGFGLQVSLSNDRLIVGANEMFQPTGTPGVFQAMGNGAAYIFYQNQGGTNNWGQVRKITASDGSLGDGFAMVDIDADIAVVGAWNKGNLTGGAYIYSRNQGGTNNWGQIKLMNPTTTGFAGFGNSVGVSGDNIVVGSYYESGGGYAYTYNRNQGGTNNWGNINKIRGSSVSSNDWFGAAVAIDGDHILVGAAGNNSTFGPGDTYVFKRNQGGTNNWGQIQQLNSSDGVNQDHFGMSVSIKQDRIIIGADYNDDGGTSSGSAYIFTDCFSSTPSSILASATPICQGSNTTLSVVGGSLGTGATWEWYTGSCGGTSVGSGSSITVSPSSITTYYVRAEGSCNTTACASLSVSVTSYAGPANNTTTTTAICETSTKTLSGSPNGGTWSIISGGGSISGTSYTPAGPFLGSPGQKNVTIRYSIAANGPCPSSFDEVTFTVYENPGAAVNNTSNASICITDTKTLTGSPSGGTWNIVSGGGSISGTTYTPVGPFLGSPGQKNVTISYSIPANGACLGTSDNVTFTVYDTASADWTPPGSICESAGLVNLNTYLQPWATTGGGWSGHPSVSSVGVFDPTGLSGSSINVKYKVGNGSCEDSVTHTISIVPSVDPSWTSPGSVCESSGLINLDTTLTSSATTGGTWSGAGVSGSVFDPTGLSGAISIKYIVGTNPCIDSLSQNITVLVSPIAPTVTVSNDSICLGDTVVITASGSGPSVIYNIYDSLTGGTFVGQTPWQTMPTVTTTYYVEAIGTNNCANTGGRQPVTVVVNNLPVVSAGTDETICVGDSVTLTATGGGTYSWSNGALTASTTVKPTTDSTFKVTVTNNSGCQAEDSVTIFIQTTGSVLATNDQAIVVTGDQENINVYGNDNGNVNSISIVIPSLNGASSVNGGDIIYQSTLGYIGLDSVQYSICDANCSNICDTAWLYIEVENDLFIPNGVSPNNDGKNDVWEILGLSKYDNNSVTIFNRWGDQIFYAKPYKNDWYGKSDQSMMGDEVIEGTYFYILDLGNKEKVYNGYIELKK